MDDKYKYHPLMNAKVATLNQLKNAKYRPDTTFNLTLERQPYQSHQNPFNKGVMEDCCSKLEDSFHYFYRFLSRQCYGSRWEKTFKLNETKMVRLFANIEIGKGGSYHLHGSAETPHKFRKNKAVFLDKIASSWARTRYGSEDVYHFEDTYDNLGWHGYMMKDLNKHNSLGYISTLKF